MKSAPSDNLRVAFLPNSRRRNPYLDLLEAGLHEIGVRVAPIEVDSPSFQWVSQNRGEVDVLHFHWLHQYYQRVAYSRSLARILVFWGQLSYAKLLGYRIVWTMHNLYPHERRYPRLDYWVRRLILLYADAVLVHCNAGKTFLSESFGRRHGVFVAPHGNYIGVYPDMVVATSAREHLGLRRDHVVLLHMGALRPYKGLEQLVESLKGIRDPNLTVMIAGKAHDDDFAAHLNRITKGDPRIKLRMGWIPSDEVALYFRAADVVVCPFEHVLTSGTVMLALSFGCPVVAPKLGCIPELVNADVGILYDPEDARGLSDALARCLTADLACMGQKALLVAASYGWHETAQKVLNAYTGDQEESSLP